MGITELSKYIRANTNAYTPIHLSHFFNKKIAVDISVYLYKTIRSVGDQDWIAPMIRLLLALKKNGIKVVCVFDGPNPPPEKQKEQAERRENSNKVKDKSDTVLNLLAKCEAYRDSFGEAEVPRDLRNQIRDICKKQKNAEKFDEMDYRSITECIKILLETYKKFEKQCIKITRQHSLLVKDIVETLGFATHTAFGEAETLCSYMAVKGLVDAVLTEDTDVLAYGTPIFLSKIDVRAETVMQIRYDDLIQQLDLTSEQFKDFCIMCGCDYNNRIKFPQKEGKKQTGVGPAKAYKLLKEHGSIENIEYMTNFDTTPLIYQRCRELFTVPDIYNNITVPLDNPLNMEKLRQQLTTHIKNTKSVYNSVRWLIQDIEEVWKPTPIVFVD